eukprot:jgi/Botrbrau1/19364/Bobra.0471s0001.1
MFYRHIADAEFNSGICATPGARAALLAKFLRLEIKRSGSQDFALVGVQLIQFDGVTFAVPENFRPCLSMGRA